MQLFQKRLGLFIQHIVEQFVNLFLLIGQFLFQRSIFFLVQAVLLVQGIDLLNCFFQLLLFIQQLLNLFFIVKADLLFIQQGLRQFLAFLFYLPGQLNGLFHFLFQGLTAFVYLFCTLPGSRQGKDADFRFRCFCPVYTIVI
ncbi:hypothetical protein D3C87_1637860 [compost metagenome]